MGGTDAGLVFGVLYVHDGVMVLIQLVTRAAECLVIGHSIELVSDVARQYEVLHSIIQIITSMNVLIVGKMTIIVIRLIPGP